MANSYLSIATIEKEIRKETEIFSKYLAEKQKLETSNQSIQSSIIEKTNLIQQLHKRIKELTNYTEKEIIDVNEDKKFNLSHETITKELLVIQNSINQNFVEKFQISSIEMLSHLQKQIQITYVIIKRLILDEDFFIQNKINRGDSLVDDLLTCSKTHKLNYYTLKSRGPSIIIHITNDTTINNLFTQSCKIFNVPMNNYSLYDDSFNNLGTCFGTTVQNYFLCSGQIDTTIPKGIIVFYLLNKLSNQKTLVESQYRSIIQKTENEKDENSLFQTDLDNCIDYCMKGNMMKGLRSMKEKNENMGNIYLKKIENIPNNFYFFLICIALVTLSFFSAYIKRDKNGQITEAITNNNFYFENIYSLTNNPLKTMKNYLQYSYDLTNESELIKYNFELVGLIQWRFLKVKKEKCLDILGDTKFENFINSQATCYYRNHNKKTRDETGYTLSSNNYDFASNLDISSKINTMFGSVDNSGTIFNYWSTAPSSRTNLGNELVSATSFDDLYGFELTYLTKVKDQDIYIINQFVIQRDTIGLPKVSIINSEPFTNPISNFIFIIDCSVGCIYLLLTILVFVHYIKKYKQLQIPGFKIFIKEIYNESFQISNFLFFASLIFYILSFCYTFNFNNNFKSMIEIDNLTNKKANIDYLSLSKDYNDGKYHYILSLFLFSLYLIRFLGIFDAFHSLIVTIQKVSYEYYTLFLIIALLLITLSLFSCLTYSSSIKEYQNIWDSLATNLKLFIFVDNTSLFQELIKKKRFLSICYIVILVIIIRFFLMALITPIFIEYNRLQKEEYLTTKKLGEQISFCKSKFFYFIYIEIFLWICPCQIKNYKESIIKKKTEKEKLDLTITEN